jgi:NTE family protein
MMMTPQTARIVGLLCVMVSGCAHRATPPLVKYDLKTGYRFERLSRESTAPLRKNSNAIFVVLAFSGGGTRAAALSTGVLHELAAVKFHLNPDTGQPCTPGPDEPGCETTPRSLLDEVDVISSVSGGSFAAAYYALQGLDILDRKGRFQTDFLYYPIQRDLFANALFYPSSWRSLGMRTEIAARLYEKRIFDGTTYGTLAKRTRPYIILNGTDSTTGARFEFTQEQFDLLCADLSGVPVARGVTGSSAFPGLLNTLTIDSHNKAGCHYAGPGLGAPTDWVTLALQDRWVDQARYGAAQDLLTYRDPNRQYLHILDGGLADNIGLRSVIQSIASNDQPVQRNADGTKTFGGWSILNMINTGTIKTLIVITVNARTRHDSNADTHSAGPSTVGVIGATSGIPMGNYSNDTLQLLQTTLIPLVDPIPLKNLKTLAVEVTFDDLKDAANPADSELRFFRNLPTSFELLPFEVDCLIDRGGQLLRDATSVERGTPTTFSEFVTNELKGEFGTVVGPHRPTCTEAAAKKAGGIRSHYIDVGVEFGGFAWHSPDVKSHHGPGVAVRLTRPNGISAIAEYTSQSYTLASSGTGTAATSLGDLHEHAVLGGVAYTWRIAQLEASAGAAAGYAFHGFDLSGAARDAFGQAGLFGVGVKASGAAVIEPRVSLWQNLTNRFAAGINASYLHSKPTVTVTSGDVVRAQHVNASAVRISAGLGFKVF